MDKKMKIQTLTPRQVSQLYGLNEGTLANLRCRKVGPRYFLVGRKVLYAVEDIEAWVKRTVVQTRDSILGRQEG